MTADVLCWNHPFDIDAKFASTSTKVFINHKTLLLLNYILFCKCT